MLRNTVLKFIVLLLKISFLCNKLLFTNTIIIIIIIIIIVIIIIIIIIIFTSLNLKQ